MPDDHARAADDTRKLRARFPGWGILFDPLERVWVAVRGKRTLVAASSPEKLTEQVEAAARGEAGPDEGDKTKTWRALRKHGRGLAAAAGRNGAASGGFLANGNDASAALTLQIPEPPFGAVGASSVITGRGVQNGPFGHAAFSPGRCGPAARAAAGLSDCRAAARAAGVG